MRRVVRFGARSVEMSNLDKVFFPESGITKGDVLDYYQNVAPQMLRHIEGRPLTLQRFPDGIGEDGFYQKQIPDHFPSWISRTVVTLEDGSRQEQVTADTRATLAFLAQQGTVTLHSWTSREPELRHPDRMVFDLDPPDGTSFKAVRRAARRLRKLLEAVGLSPWIMITGSSGAHVWTPIRRGPDFEAVRAFARGVADLLSEERPDELTTESRKAKREGRLFIDVARNAKGQTVVAPYSLRARPGAPVAAPIDWDELREVEGSRAFTLRSMPRRLAQRADPWKGLGRHAADLRRAEERWKRQTRLRA